MAKKNQSHQKKGKPTNRIPDSGERKPASKPRKPDTGRRKPHFGLLIALLSFLLYANTLNHQFAFDDAIVITQNSFTQQGFAGIPDLITTDFFVGIYGEEGMELTGGRYRPLSLVMFAAENQLFGSEVDRPAGRPIDTQPGQKFYSYNPFVGHLINLLFYALSVFLLFQLLSRWFPQKPIVALLGAILFAIHPIHSEVVANIKSRDEIMALFFVLLSLLHFDTWIKKGHKMAIIWSCLFFFLGSLAKENAFTYIAIIPIILWVIYEKDLGTTVKKSLPILAMAFAYLFLRTSMVGLPSTEETNPSILENPFVNADFATKYGTIFLILLRYIGKLILPLTLTSDYSYQQIPYVGFGNWEAILGIVLYVALVVLLIWGWRRKNALAVFSAAYLFPLSIASNAVFNIGAPMGERFVYMSSVGFVVGLVYYLSIKFKINTWPQLKSNSLLLAVFGVMSAFYIYKTFDRNPDWYDNPTLFAADVENSPKSAKANYYHANTLLKKHMANPKDPQSATWLAESKKFFTRSVELYPDFQLSWYNLGLLSVEQENGEAALPYLKRSLALNPNDPKALSLLGQVYGRFLNQPAKGIPPLRAVIENYGLIDEGVLQNLGIAYAMTGKLDSASYYFQKSIDLSPNNAKGYENMGGLLLQSGRKQEAQRYFQKAKELKAKQ